VAVCEFAGRARLPSAALCKELALAIRAGDGVSAVLRDHEISRTTYYRWRSIASGEFVEWFDGCKVDEEMRMLCWNLTVELVTVELERKQTQLDRLLVSRPQGSLYL
jgi:transposase-like protein